MVYARYLPWIENSVPVVTNVPLPINVDGNFTAYSVRVVNNTDGPIYFRRDSTLGIDTAEGVIRGGGAVLNFPEPVHLLTLLPQKSGTIDLVIAGEAIPDIFQAQELTRWGETSLTDETRAFPGGRFGSANYPASEVYAIGDWAGVEVYFSWFNGNGDASFDIQWYTANFVSGAPFVEDDWDMTNVSPQFNKFRQFFPAKSPFFRFNVILASGVDQHTFEWAFSNRIQPLPQFDAWHELVQVTSVTVAAGATRTDFLAPYAGPVQFDVRTAAAANDFVIQALDSFGAVQETLYDNLNFAVNQTISPVIYLPRRVIRCQFTNNDGVGRNYRLAAIPYQA